MPTGEKPLYELMVGYFINVYMHNSASISLTGYMGSLLFVFGRKLTILAKLWIEIKWKIMFILFKFKVQTYVWNIKFQWNISHVRDNLLNAWTSACHQSPHTDIDKCHVDFQMENNANICTFHDSTSSLLCSSSIITDQFFSGFFLF